MYSYLKYNMLVIIEKMLKCLIDLLFKVHIIIGYKNK